MGQVQIYIEVSDIQQDSCEVLITGTDVAGVQCVIDAQQVEWPIRAREWRAFADASRRWLTTEAVPLR